RMDEPRYNEICIDDRICPSDLKCAICHHIYVSPVMLSCGHSFCSTCAVEWLNKRHNCPTCRRGSNGQPIKNIALGQIVEEHNRILADEGPIPSDPLGSDDEDDLGNMSACSATPAETFVRGLEIRLSKRIRKNSNKLTENHRRLHSTGGSSPSRSYLDSPVFVRTNTVRFAQSLDQTPLHVAAARKRLDSVVFPGRNSREECESPVTTNRFERNPRGRMRTHQYSSPSRNQDNNAPIQSPVAEEMKRGGILRRSLGLLRKSVRLLRRDSTKSQQEDSIDECKEEENGKMITEKKDVGDRQAFNRKSLRKSIIRRLRGWKNSKEIGVTSASDVNVVVKPKEGPQFVSAARILIIDSTSNLELADFLRSLSDMPSEFLPHIRVLTPEERRELPLLREEYEGLQLVSIVFKHLSDSNRLVLFDIYEGRREMSGEVEHCSLLLKCCNAVLLFGASDPSSALQATSDFRYVQTQRKEMNLPILPIWTVHAVQSVETPPRGRTGSSSGNGGANQSRKVSLAHANRLTTTELSTRLLPTKQMTLSLSQPPRQEFVVGVTQLLSELKSVAISIE
ncbi:hypothetical protein PFISCL1PPCAC_15051, partial [Pristionchus fissidentatus]